MAPETVRSLIVLDLEDGAGEMLATRHVVSDTPGRFLVKWYPLRATPVGYQPLAGGVAYVPQGVYVAPVEGGVQLERTRDGHGYRQDTDMLVLILPRRMQLLSAEPGPTRAKAFEDRLAVYWLRAPGQPEVDVKWSLTPSGADPEGLAVDINTRTSRAQGGLPVFSIDDCEFYDFALSYASEERATVEAVATRLEEGSAHVFFDVDEEALLLGKDLSKTLADIYATRARYCIVFVSKAYARKMWTNVERKAALEEAGRRRGREYILPVQMDDTHLEGLPPGVVSVSVTRGPAHIAALMLDKLRRTSPR